MSSYDTEKLKVIPMPISKDYQTVIYHTNMTNKEGRPTEQVRILMAPITEKEEALLDDGKAFIIHRGDLSFNLSSDNVFAYGEVDFHKGTEDYENIGYLIPYRDRVHLPLHYDYDTHTCKTKLKRYQTYETDNIGAMAQYAHGRLGKPKRVVIFKLIAKRS